MVVPPSQAVSVVADAVKLGIKRVWLQPGAESDEAVKLCQGNGVSYVTRSCIIMHANPTGFHGFHRWIWGLLGKL